MVKIVRSHWDFLSVDAEPYSGFQILRRFKFYQDLTKHFRPFQPYETLFEFLMDPSSENRKKIYFILKDKPKQLEIDFLNGLI